jgi:hypothetical protein
VKVILFNIFGGITRTDDVANGIVTGRRRRIRSRFPIVIRLTGTNEEIAMKIPDGERLHRVVRHDEACHEGRRAREEERPREHLHRQLHKLIVRALYGPRWLVPHEADDRVWHEGRGRRHAGKGRPERSEGTVPSSTPFMKR